MTKAENHELILNGANNGSEFQRALNTAKSESTAEEYDADVTLCTLEFADGSRLNVNIAARFAGLA